MGQLGSEDLVCRVAVVGAGPSGFYVADAFFRSGLNVQVDAIDALPTPYGLLRGGVAPDHQKMKSVGAYYERVADKNKDAFNFIGNVTVGKDVSVDELKLYYDVIVFSYGSSDDRKLGLPGEDLQNNFSAREFVGWYNGHPDYTDYKFDLSSESVVIIGQGNVAVDVARILVKTDEELQASDISPYAQEALKKSKVKDIYMLGRRGPVQASFTNQEIKELGQLADCQTVINPDDMDLSEADQIELKDENNNKARKNIEALNNLLLIKNAKASKRIHLLFYKNPQEIVGYGKVEGVKLENVCLKGEAYEQRVHSLNTFDTLPCSLLFRSIGYKGTSIEGVPFDTQKGVIPNDKGRVLDEKGKPVKGFYTAGWIKRGPTGVLGTNKPDSAETVRCIIEDLSELSSCTYRSTEAFLDLLKEKHISSFSFSDWKTIDQYEKEAGAKIGKPRQKLTSVKEMLKVLNF